MNYWLEEQHINCPYCGELLTILVDCSSPDQHYIEDCQVCCRPISVQVVVDHLGELVSLDIRRDDE